MSPEMIGLIGFGLLFFLMALGMPIGFAMAGVGAVGFVYLGGLSGGLTVMGTSPYSTVGAYEMAVLPLFILMGNLAFASGITGNVYSFAHKWFSRLPGGLAMGTIGACAGFAACTGSSTAGVSVFTSTALPEMMRYKYDPRLGICGEAFSCRCPSWNPSYNLIFNYYIHLGENSSLNGSPRAWS
jgi:C4-dicarboxylate transporter DctM subunit